MILEFQKNEKFFKNEKVGQIYNSKSDRDKKMPEVVVCWCTMSYIAKNQKFAECPTLAIFMPVAICNFIRALKIREIFLQIINSSALHWKEICQNVLLLSKENKEKNCVFFAINNS